MLVRILFFTLILFSCKGVKNSASQYGYETGASVSGNFQEVLTIFNANGSGKCFSCHGGWSNYSEADYVAQGLVVYGDSANSSIYQSLFPEGTSEGIMPPAANGVLSKADKDKIKKWIDELSEEDAQGTSSGSSQGSSSGTTGGSSGAIPPPPADPSESKEFTDFYNVILNKCIWCHDLEDEYPNSPNFRMTTSDLWVSSGMIVPNNMNSSPVHISITDGSMPPSGLASLSSSELSKIETYITSLSGTSGTTTTTTMGTTPAEQRWIAARAVLANKCTGCHHATSEEFLTTANENSFLQLSEQGFLNLGENSSYIIEGMADQSEGYLRIMGSGGNNPNMPRNGSITEEQRNAIRDWINGL